MKFKWRHWLLMVTLLFVVAWWLYLISPTWSLLVIGLLVAASIWPAMRRVRWLCLALLALMIIRAFSTQNVRFVLVLPNDYRGDFYLVEHPSGRDRIKLSGLWKTTVTMHIPKSGIMVVADKTPFHYWRDDEIWRYEDGRIIKGWNEPPKPPLTYADMGGANAGGVPDDSPLARYRDANQSVRYVRGTIKAD